jgi:staphylococcal nuclease domain-containing protein 1
MSGSEDNAPPASSERKKQKKISGVGIVKAVTSGDSLILMGGIVNDGVPSEKHITLTGVVAPLFARSRSAKDNDFAWKSREHLRRKCIGKRVRFVIYHTANNGGRERNYADVTLDGVDLAHYMLRAGLVSVKMPNSPDAKIHPEKQALIDIMNETKEVGVGMWNTDLKNQVRDVNWTPDPRALFEENRGRKVHAVVDHVREGHVFRLELLGPNLAHTMITFTLAGVKCPKVPKPHYILLQEWERDGKKGQRPKPEHAEDCAHLARFYSEARLLHRDVELEILGIDKRDNFFGTIHFPLGNISIKLLQNGLGKLVKWSARLNDEDTYVSMVNAEDLAKSNNSNIWATAEESKEDDVEVHYSAHVELINSGDNITVQNLTTHEKVRVNLASIRCPRLGYRDVPDEPLAMAAREWLRKKIIGKRVQVQVQYVHSRSGRRSGGPQVFANVLLNNENLAEGLVHAGLATVQRHWYDEERSSRYERLMVAEESAVRGHRGMYATHLPETNIIEDLTRRPRNRGDGDAQKEGKGKQRENESQDSRVRVLLPFLKRKNRINSVCEHVFSGSRFKLFLPSNNCRISFALAGVRSPDKKSELYPVVLKYVQSKITQRDITVNVKAVDRGDNFIGGLWINRLNLGVHLVQKGYASVFTASARETSYSEDLFKYQREAKERKLGIWKNWVRPEPRTRATEESDSDDNNNAPLVKKGQEFINVRITEINDPNNFYVQIVGDSNIETVSSGMLAFSDEVVDDEPEDFTLEKNKLYAGQFDSAWYRVRNEGKVTGGKFRVFYVDYGNRAELDANELRTLPEDLAAIPALARQAELAGIKTPDNPDYKEYAESEFGDLCYERQLLAKVEMVEGKGGKLHLSLLEPENPVSINNQLVQNGSVRVEARPNPRISQQLIKDLKASEQMAKNLHYGVWEFGDVSDSDGENESRRYDGRPPRM